MWFDGLWMYLRCHTSREGTPTWVNKLSPDRKSGDRFQKVWYRASEGGWPFIGNVITCLEPLLDCQYHFKLWGCTVEALIKTPLKNKYDPQRRLVWSAKITSDPWGRLV